MKTCTKCHKKKPPTEFYASHGNTCKTCVKAMNTTWVKNHRAQRNAIALRSYHKLKINI